ncbi:Protein FdrA [Acidipropionibacterium acidipropionici ATCC 4875]|uniref:Protein FdrA n=1 Tax=Acidipropionibacterium acidipropionici (strain ATCC 4875 / DSM 20272 / JCM 6432 / NBRC 12425 / NCIMB 8070 / 4) TaxID=1171373 RepID=K7RU18_ACIA4|nr:DUF1116 domain-containing protein [Acidipropionibacterium acidipropionici]AFV88393.1 Protein FdrA [Acidipropionibacterium acidipropionici ATCC 4875]
MTHSENLTDISRTIDDFDSITDANKAVVDVMTAGQPVLVDVARAHTLIPELDTGEKVLLHAGPPIDFGHMPETIKGACIGAAMFEGWADDEDSARRVVAEQVRLIPCHHVGAVGPMGGITSAHMALMKVVNTTYGNVSYSTLNEGIGKVLRFGGYDAEVIERLGWMRDVLGPALSSALATTDGGYPLAPVMARALTMGDEMHQRNIAASALFAKDMAPLLARAGLPGDTVAEVSDFLGRTDQFFLNVAMAASKACADPARQVRAGSVVTAMCRNGYEFGIRVSGLGDRWFTAPVNTPSGLFFTGYDQSQAAPDMGDSAIMETFGLGGMSIVAAPGVTPFLGAGGFSEALATTEEMAEVVTAHNPNMPIPTWNFQGAPTGIDIRLVVQTGITPIINSGIASKHPGVGQIGAGTVRAPMGCFTRAVEALAEVYGVDVS